MSEARQQLSELCCQLPDALLSHAHCCIASKKLTNLLFDVFARIPAVSRHGAQRDVVKRRAEAEEEIRLKPRGSGQVVRLKWKITWIWVGFWPSARKSRPSYHLFSTKRSLIVESHFSAQGNPA